MSGDRPVVINLIDIWSAVVVSFGIHSYVPILILRHIFGDLAIEFYHLCIERDDGWIRFVQQLVYLVLWFYGTLKRVEYVDTDF